MANRSIGILGLGSIGTRHFASFMSLGCSVYGYDPARDQLPSRKDVLNWADAIVIASPTPEHIRDIFSCTAINKPMLVEKPITHCLDLKVDTSNVLMVGYNLRFHSCVKKVREWMATGAIGKPLWSRFTCAQYNDKPAYRRDGVILNWSHELDLVLYLLGGGHVVSSVLRNDPEDLAIIVVRHNVTGCHSTVHLDYLTISERRGFCVVGDSGSIDCDLVNRQCHLKDERGKLIHNFYGTDTFDRNYLEEAQAFLDRIDGKETLGCTAYEAMKVVELCNDAKVIGK